MEEHHYEELEQKARQAFSLLGDDLSGEFYPLTNMSKEVQQRLIDDHFLFKEGDRFLEVWIFVLTAKIDNIVKNTNCKI